MMTTNGRERDEPCVVFSLERDSRDRIATVRSLARLVTPLLEDSGLCEVDAVLWTSLPRADSRIVRHKGFWRLHERLRPFLPDGVVCESTLVEGDDGVRFLATARFMGTQLAEAMVLVHRHVQLDGVVVVRGRGSVVEFEPSLQRALWKARAEIHLARVLLPLCERLRVAVIVPTGRFDDRDTGIFLCGPRRWGELLPDLVVARLDTEDER